MTTNYSPSAVAGEWNDHHDRPPQIGEYSDDRRWIWNGDEWVTAYGLDGLSWWDGYQWVAIPGAPKFLIKTYTGMHGQAATAFRAEAVALAAYGWRPDSVSIIQGDRKLSPPQRASSLSVLSGCHTASCGPDNRHLRED